MSHSHHLNQKNSHKYDKMFHQTTNSHSLNYVNNMKGNQQILDYRLFSGQYEQNPSNPFASSASDFNENALQNRKEFFNQVSDSSSIKNFNQSIDRMHMPMDLQRPVATRDQVKGQYEDDNKTLYKHKQTNDYFNEHQFMPSRLGSRYGNGLDFYDVDNSMFSENKDGTGLEKYF
jgi:hypothetical protein